MLSSGSPRGSSHPADGGLQPDADVGVIQVVRASAWSRPEIGGVLSISSRCRNRSGPRKLPGTRAQGLEAAQRPGDRRSTAPGLVEVTLRSMPLTPLRMPAPRTPATASPPRPPRSSRFSIANVARAAAPYPSGSSRSYSGPCRPAGSLACGGLGSCCAGRRMTIQNSSGSDGPPVSRRAPRPRAAVHDQRGHAIRVPQVSRSAPRFRRRVPARPVSVGSISGTLGHARNC